VSGVLGRKWAKEKPLITCANCSQIFRPKYINPKTRFCSKRCVSLSTQGWKAMQLARMGNEGIPSQVLTCSFCKKTFQRPESHIRSESVCCSHSCASRLRGRKRTKTIASAICRQCSKTFTFLKSRRPEAPIYCSYTCNGLSKRQPNLSGKRCSGQIETWSKKVRKRDGYKCVRCGDKRRLHAHHILSFSKHPDLAYDVANGETLCVNCHAKEHPEIANLIKKVPGKLLRYEKTRPN
jgi:5-methylcytosine-specific restriction endonuclease McrA/endogenous inhibitor of DNA gyrase (YacG/DUF329 family)